MGNSLSSQVTVKREKEHDIRSNELFGRCRDGDKVNRVGVQVGFGKCPMQLERLSLQMGIFRIKKTGHSHLGLRFTMQPAAGGRL
jgi:hypothetical protein